MSFEEFTVLMLAAGDNPTVLLICALCIFAAGALAGLVTARHGRDQLHDDAGDTHAQMSMPPMRTANSSLIDLQARRLVAQAGEHPRARAGRSHLKPSYDGRKHADEQPRT